MEQNNLPVEVKEKGLRAALKNNPNLAKFADIMRRAGIIAGSSATAIVGLAMTAAGAAPIAIVGGGVALAGISTAIRNSLNKTEPTLLFTSQKRGDAIAISQDPLDIVGAEKMRGYELHEKAAMMGLQTLVGFSRYKQNFRNAPYELDEKGQKIYAPKISTVTHGINLKNFECLEKLGYIKIDAMDEDFPLETLDEKLLMSNEKPRRSFLLTEKIGFRNWQGVKRAIEAMRSKDEKFREENSVIMKKVTFRLTDKPIDFEEIKKFSDDKYRAGLPRELKYAAKRFSVVGNLMNERHLEIGKDSFGRDIIKYPSMLERTRINKDIKQAKKEKEQVAKSTRKYEEQQAEFNQRLHEGVEQPQIAAITKTPQGLKEDELNKTTEETIEL